MEHIYIAFVDTTGLFADMIRSYLKQRYIHVVISLDEELQEAYSVGRRNPFIPLLAGFERENKQRILQKYPKARYRVCELTCTHEQKERITRRLREDYQRRYSIHYAVLGLLFLVAGRDFYQKNHYTCSSYLARLLEENGLAVSSKHFSRVTPKDFYESQKKVVFEGALCELATSQERVVAYE